MYFNFPEGYFRLTMVNQKTLCRQMVRVFYVGEGQETPVIPNTVAPNED